MSEKSKVALMLSPNGIQSGKRTAQIIDAIKYVAPNGTIVVATVDEWEKHKNIQSKLDKAVEALETIAKTEKTIYPHSMDNDKRFNMGIASAALREINEKSP